MLPQMMETITIQRIKQRLKELGLTPRAASLEAGLSADAIRNMLRNPKAIPRGRTLIALAEALDVTVEWLLGQDAPAAGAVRAKPGLPYGGIVEAGAYREVDMLNQDSPRIIPVPRDPAFPRCRQYAFEVRGDSMNLAGIEEGMWVIGIDYLDYTEWHGEACAGMMVVVERSRAQGAERELTVKELRFFRDHAELVPRSSNPEHKALKVPLQWDGDQADSIRILAIVTGAMRLFRYD